MKILLLEDSIQQQLVIESSLRQWLGSCVLITTNLLESALEISKELEVDGAILDCQTPDNRSFCGLSLLTEYLEEKHTPYVVYTNDDLIASTVGDVIYKGNVMTLVKVVRSWKEKHARMSRIEGG